VIGAAVALSCAPSLLTARGARRRVELRGKLLQPSLARARRDRAGGDREAGKRGVIEREHGPAPELPSPPWRWRILRPPVYNGAPSPEWMAKVTSSGEKGRPSHAERIATMRRPNRQDSGWEPIATLPRPLTAAETRTVWLLPRDGGLLPREWVLKPGVEVPTDQFSHWRDNTGPS
jgi:hypothetical protein